MKLILQQTAILGIMGLLAAGCRPAAEEAPAPESRTLDMSSGPVHLIVNVEPSAVRLERDVQLSFEISAPSHLAVELPAIADRLSGFADAGRYGSDPVTAGGVTSYQVTYLLTPIVAEEYRVAPMAIVYRSREDPEAEPEWFATQPIHFSVPDANAVSDDLADVGDPIWIAPPFRVVAAWTVIALLLLAVLAVLWAFRKKIHRAVRLYRMSPRQRAMLEFEELLARNLIEAGEVKEFYFGLTLVVRRYIERAHAVRAPEQTTEEFLKIISQDPRFGPHVLRKLKYFLQAADLVKFAAFLPVPEAVQEAVDTARSYVETDAASSEPDQESSGV